MRYLESEAMMRSELRMLVEWQETMHLFITEKPWMTTSMITLTTMKQRRLIGEPHTTKVVCISIRTNCSTNFITTLCPMTKNKKNRGELMTKQVS